MIRRFLVLTAAMGVGAVLLASIPLLIADERI